jgi:transposase
MERLILLVTRAYKLKVYGNISKLDTARYTYEKHLAYVNHFACLLFFNGNKTLSTSGMGQLANQAQYKARGIISAIYAAGKATGNKLNAPYIKTVGCPAKIEESDNSFDYWITVENQFEKCKRVDIPVKSHRVLNKSLKTGWILNPVCEFVKEKDKFYARVFIQKEVKRANPRNKSLGCDVGYRNSVSRSDGYIGRNSSKAIRKIRIKQASRQSQNLRSTTTKTYVKQIIDREAKQAVRRSKRLHSNLVVESPKVLANLRSGKLQGWSRNYFFHRCETLGKESSVFVRFINPAYTSATCCRCGNRDKRSRSGIKFTCVYCGFEENADVNASVNIARKGTLSIERCGKVAK